MDIQNITNKETATQNEQQLKSKQDIIKDIINLLAENNLSIDNAKEILRPFQVLCKLKKPI